MRVQDNMRIQKKQHLNEKQEHNKKVNIAFKKERGVGWGGVVS